MRRARPESVLVAIPVAPAATVRALSAEADATICLHSPLAFLGVGMWYADFSQTTDHEVRSLLAASHDFGQGVGSERARGPELRT
jgi:predicted phosphoribosyltransferase